MEAVPTLSTRALFTGPVVVLSLAHAGQDRVHGRSAPQAGGCHWPRAR